MTPTALTVTEEDATADSYTVVLDTQPTADVMVTVSGHVGHGRDPVHDHHDLHDAELGYGPDGDRDCGRRCRHYERFRHADPHRRRARTPTMTASRSPT